MANLQNKNNVTSVESTKSENGLYLYPVVLGSPETSVTLDTDSVNSEPEDWTVHVENSSDVVIGPLTQFHGPVTIYQNIKTDTQKSLEKLPSNYKSDVTVNKSKFGVYQQSRECQPVSRKNLIITTLVLATVLTVVILLSLTLSLPDTETTTEIIVGSPNPPSFGNHRMITRAQWGGRSPLNFTKPLSHPTEYVLVSHTASETCNTLSRCSAIMQQTQSQHVSELGSPDIGYNFLIANDGNIYIGRGWDVVNFHGPPLSIGVCFIGHYVYDYLTAHMMDAFQELLVLGVELNKLAVNYRIVAHNQTYPTLSPGRNVYAEISKLPHFYNGTL